MADNIRLALARYKNQGTPSPDGAKYVVLTFDDPDAGLLAEFTLPDQYFQQPPVVFEQKYNLIGIAHQYKLPKGLAATDIESYVTLIGHDLSLSDKQRNDKIDAVWRLLKKLNPALRGLHDAKKHPQLTHFFICGVTSAINPADMRYFAANYISTGNPNQRMRESPLYQKLGVAFNAVAPRLPDDIDWAASPKTLRHIRKQLQGQKRTL